MIWATVKLKGIVLNRIQEVVEENGSRNEGVLMMMMMMMMIWALWKSLRGGVCVLKAAQKVVVVTVTDLADSQTVKVNRDRISDRIDSWGRGLSALAQTLCR